MSAIERNTVTLASSVIGNVGSDRAAACLQVLTLYLAVSIPVFFVVGFRSGQVVWICGALTVFLVVSAVAFNLLASGPWRCIDVSVPVRFTLTHEKLEVMTWGGLSSRTWDAESIESIGVYKQAGTWPVLDWSRQGVQQRIDGLNQVYAELPSSTTPLMLCLGRRVACTSAFLGVKIRNDREVVFLSRRIWHASGIQELFDLAEQMRLFQAGELPAAGIRAVAGRRHVEQTVIGAREEEIGRLPSGSFSIPEGSETLDCIICLDTLEQGDVVCTLPCNHIFHQNCAVDWLRINGVCPVCKRVLTSDIVGSNSAIVRVSL
eukprot:TRINITY_DN63167_c0_g1_i1.p1 TRINITY_DN63167_c0_g1~~TRINITY_DN63167_c0_g1_i1.p1  ORF type:complete len:319 (+),score=39.72 TRINITY_DN63167_c0_g1_i1:68-1024(+)